MGPEQRVLVFVGPSFPPARVREFVSSAEVRRPIRRGDLDDIAPPALVAIIDGVWGRESNVSPREIRTAIARGVRLVGSSGTGALRAAEVPEMIGVGRIYDMYRRGSLQRDDEVAVLLDTDGETALTEPLANVRFAADTLVRAGTIGEQMGAAIVEAASALHFHDRTYRNILQKAGLSELGDAGELISILQSIDLIAEDAQTLLERLLEFGSDARWSRPFITSESDIKYGDHFESIRVPATVAVDAPLSIWEFGEQVAWAELFDFLAATGRLDTYARRVLARLEVEREDELDDGGQVPSVQDLFGETMLEWGWEGAEEVHVTLTDLGIGFDDLQQQLRNERNVRKKLRGLFASRDGAFMRALRHDLLTDLALKREVMRVGALHALAHVHPCTPAELTDGDIEDAKRALLCERPELTWEGLLEEGAMHEADAQRIVNLVASARRVGVALLDKLDKAPRAEGIVAAGVDSWPLAPRATGSPSRSMADDAAATVARRIGDVIGVTRVGQLGEFERFGLHVASAYRPSNWSSTVGSGKGESREVAIVGALMEELEKYCQERFEPDVIIDAPYRQLRPDRGVDPVQCALPYDSSYHPAQPIAWSWMSELVTNERLLVPAALLSVRRGRHDVLYSPRKGTRIFSSSGLASGFTTTEALVHALCERIERHAIKLAEQAVSNPGQLAGASRWPYTFIDLNSCPESTQFILAGIRRAGYEVRVMDVTSEVSVPTFSARIFRPAATHGLDGKYSTGSCTHPNPVVAINRAVLEAVQTCIAALSGTREDLGIRARSLGRHERPRPLSRGDAYWIRPHVPKKSVSSVAGAINLSAREDLDFVVRRLTAAGFHRVMYRDLSRDEAAPACVVRALVLGMEDTNPFHTGLRARTLMVQDLMRHHEW